MMTYYQHTRMKFCHGIVFLVNSPYVIVIVKHVTFRSNIGREDIFYKGGWFRIRVCGRILHALNLFQVGTKYVLFILDGNNNVHPRTGQEDPEGE